MKDNVLKGIVEESVKRQILCRNSRNNPFSLDAEVANNCLMEGYFATYDMETVKKYLNNRYGDGADIYIMDNENGEKVFRVVFADEEYNKKIVDRDMSLAGYFPSYINRENGNYDIQYEPRFQNKVNQEVLKRKFIYHLTPKSKMLKILEKGLTPKSNNKKFNYPDRIYFFLDKPTVEICQTLIDDFKKEEIKNHYVAIKNKEKHIPIIHDEDYLLLKINTNKLEGISFFYDPNASECIYSKENIKPSAIETEEIIKNNK